MLLCVRHTLILITYHLSSSFIYILYTAKNVPLAASALKKARAIIGYFESSTQAMGKLLDFQRNSTIEEYKNQKKPKKPLQDVVTRWWSTYRSLRRLRWLKKAIKGLIATGEVSIEDLSADEWLCLHQIEIVLETMAYWQRILEGEKYVTGSLSTVAVYQVRQAFEDAIGSEHTEEPVKNLTQILLDDFDQRYHPAEGGKVRYFREDVLGRGQRYIGLHQYFFFASFLDPRVLQILVDIMTNEDFQQLKDDIIDQMVAKSKAMKKKKKPQNQGQECTSPTATAQPKSKKPSKASQMLRGLNTKPKASNETEDNDDELRDDCRAQLNRYMKDALKGVCSLEDDDGEFNDPLEWWKDNMVKYDLVAHLARLYLAIPATSAPSERIWSRASRILTLKRASLSEELVARMMYVRENIRYLRKHYVELAAAEREAHLHDLIEYELEYLPSLNVVSEDEGENELDVGQEDHLLEF